MAPRVDKTESAIGGFRATLANDIPEASLDVLVGVSLDAQGRAVLGADGQSGVVGITIPTKWLSKAGQQIDIFRHGDVVDLEGLSAGTRYYIDADGALTDVAASGFYAGHTTEADHLILGGFAQAVANPAA